MHRLYPEFAGGARAVALLFLRLVAGTAFVIHGWPKIQNPMSWLPPEAPIPGWLQLLAAVSEFGGGIAWIPGRFPSDLARRLIPGYIHPAWSMTSRALLI